MREGAVDRDGSGKDDGGRHECELPDLDFLPSRRRVGGEGKA